MAPARYVSVVSATVCCPEARMRCSRATRALRLRAGPGRRWAGRISYLPRPTRLKYFQRCGWFFGAFTQQRLTI